MPPKKFAGPAVTVAAAALFLTHWPHCSEYGCHGENPHHVTFAAAGTTASSAAPITMPSPAASFLTIQNQITGEEYEVTNAEHGGIVIVGSIFSRV